jgi:hypothetical protein
MKTLFLIALFTVGAYAQECPPDKVCISREAAITAVTNAEKVVALETEGKAKDKALTDMLAELNKMRVEFAEKVGELTATKQNDVANRAIIELLLKNSRKKCMPLSICF